MLWLRLAYFRSRFRVILATWRFLLGRPTDHQVWAALELLEDARRRGDPFAEAAINTIVNVRRAG